MIHVASTFSSLLTFWVWYKISPGWSVLYVCQSSCHLNSSLSVTVTENIQGSKVQLSLILNSALDNSCVQLHASATVLPGRNWYTHCIGGARVISRAAVGDVASCILYFSSINIFWQYMTAYKQHFCHAVWRYDVQCEPKVTFHLYSINQEHRSEWIVMSLQTDQASTCISTSTWL